MPSPTLTELSAPMTTLPPGNQIYTKHPQTILPNSHCLKPSGIMATATATRHLLFPSLTLLGAGAGLAYTLPHPLHRCDSNTNTYPTFSPSPTTNFSILNPTTWRLFRPAPPPPPPPPPTAIKTTFNPVHYRQLSSGSFTGLFAGLAVAHFSRTLAVVVGLLVCIVEVC